MVQCLCTISSGRRCKRKASPGSKYCPQHKVCTERFVSKSSSKASPKGKQEISPVFLEPPSSFRRRVLSPPRSPWGGGLSPKKKVPPSLQITVDSDEAKEISVALRDISKLTNVVKLLISQSGISIEQKTNHEDTWIQFLMRSDGVYGYKLTKQFSVCFDAKNLAKVMSANDSEISIDKKGITVTTEEGESAHIDSVVCRSIVKLNVKDEYNYFHTSMKKMLFKKSIPKGNTLTISPGKDGLGMKSESSATKISVENMQDYYTISPSYNRTIDRSALTKFLSAPGNRTLSIFGRDNSLLFEYRFPDIGWLRLWFQE